jgi:hypothetical protein
MNTNLEDRLRADMARFTRDVRVPPGLALKACRRGRRRRVRRRVAIAAGITAVLAAGAVTAAGIAGAFVSAAAWPIQTTAYVIKQVNSALSTAGAANMIYVTRTVYTPVDRFEPLLEHFFAGPPEVSLGSAWNVAVTVTWQYHSTAKDSAYGPDGQHVYDAEVSSGPDTDVETAVLYNRGTWWTGSWPIPSLKVRQNIERRLARIDAGGPAARIRHALSAGFYKLAGRQVVDGIDAIKLTTGGKYPLTLWVDPATFLPVRFDASGIQDDYQWLAPTPANLALLDEPIPPGFRQVPPVRP